ncbi:hypothetical protein BHE74_00011352 [Ensete ventricosum]|nr:hypothetical protein BHE74_00011352 [Ensete ventricosum]
MIGPTVATRSPAIGLAATMRPPLSNHRNIVVLCLSFNLPLSLLPTTAVAAYYCSYRQYLSTRHHCPSISSPSSLAVATASSRALYRKSSTAVLFLC